MKLVEQQLLSAGSVEQWLLGCAYIDSLAGTSDLLGTQDLGRDISTQVLYHAYGEYTRRRGARPESLIMFGKLLSKLFGPSRRLPASQSGKRPFGYFIPDAAGVRRAVHGHLKA